MGLGDIWKKITGQKNRAKKDEMLEVASDKEFELLLSRCEEEEKMVVVDFYETWCRKV